MKSYAYILLLVSAAPLTCLLTGWSMIISFYVLNVGVMVMDISLYLDKYGSAFIMTVLWIFISVYLYSFSYLAEETFLQRFLAILSLFASSMCMLILSGNLFSSLIGWDGLGVTSLFLILFYYSNSSLKAATLTFLMNRAGDCFFVMTLTSILLLGESQLFWTSLEVSLSLSLLMILTSITKSAQIPFSTWLPAAMEAPTPVSALVHSSTLVTGGIFLLYRYSEVWVNSELTKLLTILSIGTCFMAALSALVENDLKKLIALSTLSQLGFIMFSFSIGMLPQGYLHMLMHAYFKALLFMCAGLVIHSFSGSQLISVMSLSSSQNPVVMVVMSFALLSMMGFPFMSGFYSKDLIIDSIKDAEWSLLTYTLLVLSFVSTVMYSIRTVWYLMKSSSCWHCMSDSDVAMLKPMYPLVILSTMGGSVMTWVLVEVETFIDSSKLVILVLLGGSAMSYWLSKGISSSEFLEKKWNLSTMNPLLSDSFFKMSLFYQKSSDLQGLPEMFNKKLKAFLLLQSQHLHKTMIQYSGSLEFMMFLAVLILLLV